MSVKAPDQSPNLSSTRNGLLDLLRFVAAMTVLIYHFLYRGAAEGGYMTEGFGAAGNAVSFGYLGVNLFFIISGYVIIWSASNRDWYGFAIGRFARLYPAHLMAMTITAIAMALWAQPPMTTDFVQWLANLTMLAPLFGQPFMDGAYWSIVIELIFYGWVMIGLFTGLLPRHTDLAVAVWLSLVVLNNLLLGSRAVELIFLTEYGSYFALGAMIWRLSSEGVTNIRLLLAGVAFALTFHTIEVQRLDVLAFIGTAGTTTQLILANITLVAIFMVTAIFGTRIGARPWMLAIGGLSYPLYLVHQNAGYILMNLLTPGYGKWAAITLTTIASLAVSWWIYRFVEPMGRSIIYSLLRPAARFLPRTGYSVPVRAPIVPAE